MEENQKLHENLIFEVKVIHLTSNFTHTRTILIHCFEEKNYLLRKNEKI